MAAMLRPFRELLASTGLGRRLGATNPTELFLEIRRLLSQGGALEGKDAAKFLAAYGGRENYVLGKLLERFIAPLEELQMFLREGAIVHTELLNHGIKAGWQVVDGLGNPFKAMVAFQAPVPIRNIKRTIINEQGFMQDVEFFDNGFASRSNHRRLLDPGLRSGDQDAGRRVEHFLAGRAARTACQAVPHDRVRVPVALGPVENTDRRASRARVRAGLGRLGGDHGPGLALGCGQRARNGSKARPQSPVAIPGDRSRRSTTVSRRAGRPHQQLSRGDPRRDQAGRLRSCLSLQAWVWRTTRDTAAALPFCRTRRSRAVPR